MGSRVYYIYYSSNHNLDGDQDNNYISFCDENKVYNFEGTLLLSLKTEEKIILNIILLNIFIQLNRGRR